MRLTYIHNAEIPSRGASTVQVMRMCSAFARLGCDVELIVPHRSTEPPLSLADSLAYYGCADAFAIRRYTMGRSGVFGFASSASRRAKERKSDLVFGRCIRSCAASAMRGLPVMHEAHGPMEAYSLSGRIAFRWLARSPRFRRLVVINGALAQYYRHALRGQHTDPLVLPSGTDPVIGASAEAIAPNGGRMRVGYVGSLFPGKGMELIEEIAQRTTHEIVVIGGDDALIAQWGKRLGKKVNFLGYMPNKDVAAHINQFDIALAPYSINVSGGSTNFNLATWMSPLKLFEYMAHARPILVSDLPAIREVVQDGTEVLMCDPTAPQDWIDAIERLAHDEELRRTLGRNALNTFLARYTWQERAAAILRSFRDPTKSDSARMVDAVAIS